MGPGFDFLGVEEGVEQKETHKTPHTHPLFLLPQKQKKTPKKTFVEGRS